MPDGRSLGERFRAFVAGARRELILLALAAGVFLAILPVASETNPAYEEVQRFLDDMAFATMSARSGDLPEPDGSGDGIVWDSAALGDGTVGWLVVGAHAGMCFAVHWRDPGTVGPRAGVLDPSLPCDASAAVFETLPSPPFVLAFPGTVPPFDAASLVKPALGGARDERVEPFPAERTRWWFVPAAVALLAVALWQIVGLTLLLLPAGRGESRGLRWRDRR